MGLLKQVSWMRDCESVEMKGEVSLKALSRRQYSHTLYNIDYSIYRLL